MNSTPGSLEDRFPQLVSRFGLTGHELAQEALSNLPDPLPKGQLPPLLAAGVDHCHSKNDFVRKCGYSNLSKGCRRLDSWLSGRELPKGQQLPGLAAALGLDSNELAIIVEQDRRVGQMVVVKARARDPSFHLVVRIMPAIYNRATMDPDLQLRQALALACGPLAIGGSHLRRCLTLPNGLCIYISQTGTLESYGKKPPTGGLELQEERPFLTLDSSETAVVSEREHQDE
jgi:hypothetical protein